MSNEGAVHQFTYAFDANLKSTLGDTVIQYVRFVSYYSHDDGQRNINEIELYDSTGQNFLYGDTLVTFSSNRDYWGNDLPENVADSNYTSNYRWSCERIAPLDDSDPLHDSINRFSQAMNAKFDTIAKQYANMEIDSITAISMLDTIVNTTVYPDFDTVWFQVNLNQTVNIQNIVFYLGEHTQVFDIWVSADGQTWTLLKPEDGYSVIYQKE